MQENLDKMVLVEIQKNKIGCSVFLKENDRPSILLLDKCYDQKNADEKERFLDKVFVEILGIHC